MLHKYGTPAFRLEAHLNTVAAHLDLDGYFLVSPTTLNYCLWEQGAPDDDVYTYSMLMRGRWHDVIWVGVLSTLVYAFVFWSGRSHRVSSMLEPLATTAVAVIAVGVSRIDPGVNQPLVVFSSIIIFVPGLSVAMGFRELAARGLISGTARIMDSLMVLFKLYFCTVLGLAIGVLIWGDTFPVDQNHVPLWIVWPAVLLLASGLSVVFKARLVDAPWGGSGVLVHGVVCLTTVNRLLRRLARHRQGVFQIVYADFQLGSNQFHVRRRAAGFALEFQR